MGTSPTAMPAPAEVQATTLEKFIQGWAGWAPDGFLANWSEDCTQKTLPFSSGVPVRTCPDTEQLFPVLMFLVSNFTADDVENPHTSMAPKPLVHSGDAVSLICQTNMEHALRTLLGSQVQLGLRLPGYNRSQINSIEPPGARREPCF
ncbi:hypothetical protein Asppvi_003749 [Aspergillus pseudoviridinutans]|uniref:Uncharacterized protein n=1 Tax=Aspergillus pseudoviridinutans TaxID=1517512 RepID=A0A9P3B902_9EURO|nr:uncharacterized protein Asppvi_003749 [Aspergillus pseudoviridinutans]GIJ84898.1 hypothetical protein Asppvi_003749 [Aspergillus pseudoviridinutans]